MNIYAIMSLALAVYFLIVFFVTTFFGLEGGDLWILRGLLALIGILGTAAYLVYYFRSVVPQRREKKARGEEGGAETGGGEGAGDVDRLVKEAESRLASSELGGKAKTANLPLLLVLGREGSTKTSSMIHCGLDPELLAGQVYQDDAVTPTAGANIWYARRSLFVEAGGKLLARADSWKRLLKRLRPGGLSSVFGGGREAPRAALVCISCEEFLKPGASDSLASLARELRARLEEASQELGARLPVYVLFTKLDRIAFFTDYARSLTEGEAGQPVGVTLPIDGDENGVYAERQSERLTRSFNNLIYSLSDRRADILPREQEEAARAGVYEFPRELRKLRSGLVQLLVDICRPSQLRAGPVLRGYYFSGVRPVLVKEAPMQRARAEQRERDVSAATMVFTAEQGVAAGRQAGAPVMRKKPQWVFLSHLFSDVLLADGLSGEGGGSVKTNRLRRLLLATAAALCLIWTIGMIVSYFGNRSLESQVTTAVREIGAGEAAGRELASVDALTRLDSVRQSLETLTRYEAEGPPFRLRWGLYCGDDLYPAVRQAYYSRFRQLLLAQTQESLVVSLRGLPEKPSPSDEYSPFYDALKAYLITTSHPDKSSREFLSPVLMRHWRGARDVDEARLDLAQRQFDFYAEDLKNGSPYPPDNDVAAIERGRSYLLQFTGVEPIYQFMLAEASRQNPSVSFNRMFPGSQAVVVNDREVPGAFTAKGWVFMQDAIKNAGRFFGGEEWVLGRKAEAGVDPAELEKILSSRYREDFINQWRAYLNDTQVVRYRSLEDAATKLGALSGNQSPLLASLWLASRHTNVENEDIKKIFQPVQFVTPPENEDRFVDKPNEQYMQSLLSLQASVEQAANAPPAQRDPAVDQVNQQATQAKIATRQVAQNFTVDPQAKVETTVQQLMERPILYAEALVRALGPGELNAKGRALCGQFASLLRKYPFSPGASEEATLAEVAAIFQPGGGAIWAFYEEDLREHLERQGARYVANPNSKIRLTGDFVEFFNRAMMFSEAVYPNGSREPRLSYKLTGFPPEGVNRLTLTIDGQTLTVEGQPASQSFVWPGDGNQRVSLAVRLGGADLGLGAYEGLWAVFRFFELMDRWQTTGNLSQLEQIPRSGGRSGQPVTVSGGRPLTLRFALEASAPVFSKDFLASLRCVSTVAR